MSLAKLERLVRDRAGLDPASLGTHAFSAAVNSRMKALGLDSTVQFADRISTDEAEWDHLLDALVVPESWFFRGGRALFDVLAKSLIATAEREGRIARALCIPCGFGEEPFSLAIAVQDLGSRLVRIDGRDISVTHLARAVEGRFSSFSFREMSPAIRDQFFKPIRGEEWQINPTLRARVRFSRCNLVDASPSGMEQYDVVMCRNVFIYLTDEARKQAVANLDRWLAPDGLLCVSPAEADRLPREKFVRVEAEHSLLYRRRKAPVAITPQSIELPKRPRKPRSSASMTALRKSSPKIPALPQPTETLESVRSLADRGDLAAALAACEKLIASQGPSPDAYGLLGVLHVAQGSTTRAIDAFTRALYLKPDHAESLEHLAVLSEQRGDRARAAALRRKLRRMTGGDA